MAPIELQTENREVLGKKVKFLRRQKLTPLHLFGHSLDSLSLQVETGKIERVLALAGETRLINLKIGQEANTRPVLVREVQRDAMTRQLLHVDLYQVKMGEKVEVEVPVILIGDAPALRIKGNGLAHELNTLTVECLPDNIPNKIEINISSLVEAGDMIRVEDVTPEPNISVLNSPEQPIVVVTAHEEEKPSVAAVAEEEAAEAPAKEAEKPEGEKGGD